MTDLHVQKYDDYGNVIEQDDYDYGSGAYGSLLDKTVISYAYSWKYQSVPANRDNDKRRRHYCHTDKL